MYSSYSFEVGERRICLLVSKRLTVTCITLVLNYIGLIQKLFLQFIIVELEEDPALIRRRRKLTNSHHRRMEPIILSDEDDPSTPFPLHSKKRRTESNPNPTVFLLDDDPTPQKQYVPSSTPSVVPETPFSPLFDSDIAIVKCTRPSDSAPANLSGHYSSSFAFLYKTFCSIF